MKGGLRIMTNLGILAPREFLEYKNIYSNYNPKLPPLSGRDWVEKKQPLSQAFHPLACLLMEVILIRLASLLHVRTYACTQKLTRDDLSCVCCWTHCLESYDPMPLFS